MNSSERKGIPGIKNTYFLVTQEAGDTEIRGVYSSSRTNVPAAGFGIQ
jgi:hypothetical protein